MGVRAGTWLLVLAAVLSACSAEERPAVLPPLQSRAPSPATDKPASLSEIPAVAMPSTASAASAFARFYLEEVNKAYATKQVELLRRLSSSECNACTNIVSDISRLKESRRSVAGQRFRVGPTAAAPPDTAGQVVVDVRYDADAYREVDGNGAILRDNAAQQQQDLQMALVRSEKAWVVRGLRLV